VNIADTAAGLRRVAQDPRIWILLGLYLFVLGTNAGFSQDPIDDAIDYHRIAAAAPDLPAQPIGSAFTAWFATHYAVGLLHWATGMSLEAAYAVAFALVLAALFATVHVLLRRLAVGDFALASALFVLNPYVLRPYELQTETLQDLVFVLGVGICLIGLVGRSSLAVLAGLVIAVLGRQTAIAVAPVGALWVLFDPRWRSPVRGRRAWPIAIAALTLTLGIFIEIRVWSARFSIPYEPTGLNDTVFNLVGGLPGTTVELAAHFARLLVPLALPLAAFVSLVVVVGWRKVSFAGWGALLLAAAIVVQPAITDPRFPGFAFNEQRLSALAVLPLVFAVATLLAQTRWHWPHRSVRLIPVAMVAVASLHHEFSSVGPNSLAAFLAIQALATAVVAGLLGFGRRNSPPATTPAAPPVLRPPTLTDAAPGDGR
jgi:hypothetical protein